MGTYYIRTDGSDSNDGLTNSSGGAWLTLDKAFTELAGTGPHTVNVGAGTYSFSSNPGNNGANPLASPLFSDVVTFVGAGNTSTTIDGFTFGRLSDLYYLADHSGAWTMNARFESIGITDESNSYGARELEFYDCKFTLPGPMSGSGAAIGRDSLNIRGGYNILIDSCEFTDTAVALALRCQSTTVLNCTIHDISHDGIRVQGCRDLIIDGCSIYNLDDGVEDSEEAWSIHNDCIHIFMQQNTENGRNVGITVRNCLMYNSADQAVQFNNYQGGSFHNADITFYNNIFGACADNIFNISEGEPVDGLDYYHNTIINSYGTKTYTSAYRTINMDNLTFRVDGTSTDVRIWNNVFATTPANFGSYKYQANNVYVGASNAEFQSGCNGKNAIFTLIDQFVDNTAMTAIPISGFVGKELGTRISETGATDLPIPATDYYGTTRGNRPDIGAYEFTDNTSSLESAITYIDDTKTVFKEDFLNGSPLEDVSLGAVAGQRGIAWEDENGTAGRGSFAWIRDFSNARNELSFPSAANTRYYLIAGNVGNFADIEVSMTFSHTGSSEGEGPLLYFLDENNFVRIAIGHDDNGTGLYKMESGVETLVDSLSGFHVGTGSHVLVATCSKSNGEISIDLDMDSGGVTASKLVSVGFDGGKHGLSRYSGTAFQRMEISSFQINGSNLITAPQSRSYPSSAAALLL